MNKSTGVDKDVSRVNRLIGDLGARCVGISEAVATSSGFVPIQALLQEFRASLESRPLLVEGMLAKKKSDKALECAVLVDSETFGIDTHTLNSEISRPVLSERLRNTIAHELVHLLPIRISEFGLTLDADLQQSLQDKSFLSKFERSVERLSPLLLIPSSKLESSLSDCREGLLQRLSEVRKVFHVSRPVFVNRLLLRKSGLDGGKLGRLPCLLNCAVGIAEVEKSGDAYLLPTPCFHAFETFVPEFVLNLYKGKKVRLSELIEKGTSFDKSSPLLLRTLVRGGTHQNPTLDTLEVAIQIDLSGTSVGDHIFFCVTQTT